MLTVSQTLLLHSQWHDSVIFFSRSVFLELFIRGSKLGIYRLQVVRQLGTTILCNERSITWIYNIHTMLIVQTFVILYLQEGRSQNATLEWCYLFPGIYIPEEWGCGEDRAGRTMC